MEGTFLACTFWLVEVLAKQGRVGLARKTFERACRCANDLGLFAEQYSTAGMLGNFPQGLTHLAHVSAAVALAKVGHSVALNAPPALAAVLHSLPVNARLRLRQCFTPLPG